MTYSSTQQSTTTSVVATGTSVLIFSVIGNGLNYLFNIFLARLLGAHDFGLYALGFTIYNALTLIAIFGLDSGIIRLSSEYLERADRHGALQTVLRATRVALISSLITSTILVLSARSISSVLYDKPMLETVLLILAAAIPFSTLTAVLIASLQGFHSVRPLIVVRYIWEPVGKFILAGALLAIGLGLFGVLGAIVVIFCGSFVIAVFYFRSVVRSELERLDFFPAGNARQLMTYCAPLMVATTFGVIAPRADMLVLGYWESPADIGIYQASFQTAAAIALILGAFETSLAPLFGQLHARGDRTQLEHAYQSASRLVFTLSVPLFILLAVFGEDILSLFGKNFSAGAIPMLILAAGQLLSVSSGSPNNVLLMGGHSKIVMWNTIGVGLTLISVILLLVPAFGIIGAAIGAATAQVLLNAVRIFQVWKLHNVQPFTNSLLKPMTAGLTSTIVLLSLKNVIPHLFWPALVTMVPFLYLGTLLILKPNLQDLQAFYAWFNRLRPIKVVEIIPEANGR